MFPPLKGKYNAHLETTNVKCAYIDRFAVTFQEVYSDVLFRLQSRKF